MKRTRKRHRTAQGARSHKGALASVPDWAWLVGAALLALLAGGVYWTSIAGGAERGGAVAAGLGAMGEQARREPGDPYAVGPADAPVVMVMFSDFRCPFCARFSRETKPELVDRYVDEGLLRIEWRDFPVFGQESRLAARGVGPSSRRWRSGADAVPFRHLPVRNLA